ncbi:uncharacterized protein LOC126372063 [Pectinophora gossypiella]|uniref:uncharacterized protein LOC126372063 n=1 Tax=Pectinophora gossypiella TaxID=13191 RepID=UPI00214EEB58|nr:uncharacterized protein LOC126372063 [Pectinophora gossypiella]
MNIHVMLVLTLGLVGALDIPKQTVSTNSQLPLSGSESEDKHDEKISSIGDSEHKETKVETTPENTEALKNTGRLEIIIEETFSPDELVLPKIDDVPQNGAILDVPETTYMDSDLGSDVLVNKVEGEIMETAAGFVPIPIIRKRQHARRRLARPHKPARPSRRYFMKNPYWTPYYLYPYYGFYRPSSLRYY